MRTKELYELANRYRKKTNEILFKAEARVHDAVKDEYPLLYKSEVWKKLVNTDIRKWIKEVNDADSHLNSNISKRINEKKNKS